MEAAKANIKNTKKKKTNINEPHNTTQEKDRWMSWINRATSEQTGTSDDDRI
jgi:hypothetical protein